MAVTVQSRLRVGTRGTCVNSCGQPLCRGSALHRDPRTDMAVVVGLMGTAGALVWLSRGKSGSDCQFVRGTTDQNYLPWSGTTVITCISYLTTGSSGKECGTNKLPPTGRIWERSKEQRRYQFICQMTHWKRL